MSKIDKLKEEKSDLKEVFKALLYAILGLLTGIATIIYQIFAGKIPAYTIILGSLALIIVFLIGLYTSESLIRRWKMWTNIIAGSVLAIATGAFIVWFFGNLVKISTRGDK